MFDSVPKKYGMGAAVRRKEDRALVSGAGCFTDDYEPEGTLRAYVVRSSMAHARIKVANTAGAMSLPGVHLGSRGDRRTAVQLQAKAGRRRLG